MNRDTPKDIKLRGVFDQQALLYDKVRPLYPDALYDSLVGAAQLADSANLLEIGPGTGQATLPLAGRGYTITAVELGEQLATLARVRLEDYPRVKIITGAFENVDLPANSFNLIYSATAFHWIKPEVRFAKPHQLLEPSGHLAIIHTNHVSDGAGDVFFNATQPIYDRYTPKTDEGFELPQPNELKPMELDTKLFELTTFKLFPTVLNYTADEYADLLSTYSPHLALSPERRSGFLNAIRDLINRDFGGSVAKHYVMSLAVAKKL